MAWHFIFSHPTLFFCATKLFVSIEFVLFFLKTPFLFYHRWIGLCSHHVRQLKSSLRYQSVGLLSGRNKTPHSAVGVVNFSPFEAPHSECRRPGRCGLNWRSTCCLTFLLFIVFFSLFFFFFFFSVCIRTLLLDIKRLVAQSFQSVSPWADCFSTGLKWVIKNSSARVTLNRVLRSTECRIVFTHISQSQSDIKFNHHIIWFIAVSR